MNLRQLEVFYAIIQAGTIAGSELSDMVNCYEMINIKLDKTGGLTEALALESEARSAGLSVMCGCMLGSSLAMKAALPIATNAEVVRGA